MISQLFILAPNGHTIVNKDYRGDVPKDSAEIFLRKLVEKSGGEAPIFNVDGVNYMSVRKSGLFFLATTLHNVPPAYVIELLTQLTKVRPAHYAGHEWRWLSRASPQPAPPSAPAPRSKQACRRAVTATLRILCPDTVSACLAVRRCARTTLAC
jgi:hypothetical protein